MKLLKFPSIESLYYIKLI